MKADKVKYFLYSDNLFQSKEDYLINEAPLFLSINNEKYKTVFRTPGEDKELIVGMLFTEGLIREVEDIINLDFENNRVFVKIKENKKRELQNIEPNLLKNSISIESLLNCMKLMEEKQLLRAKTKASHAAMLFSYNLEPISFSEDVGRHNAFDKVIGKSLFDKRIKESFLVTLSSRISFEMVKKAVMSNIEIVFAISKPTLSGVNLADSKKLTICSYNKNKSIMVYSYPERINC